MSVCVCVVCVSERKKERTVSVHDEEMPQYLPPWIRM